MISSDSDRKQVHIHPFLHIVNRVGNGLDRLGISPVDLSTESLMNAASQKTGLSDWGGNDFREGLYTILDALENQANLTLIGRFIVRTNFIVLLSNRLKMEADFKRHPEILEKPIRRPLYIIGLPRTGTTLLYNLLAQDPGARVPLLWELMRPSPPPKKETRTNDPRIAEVRKRYKQFHKLVPNLKVMHYVDSLDPEECVVLFQHTFKSHVMGWSYYVRSYTAWLLKQNMIPTYEYYRKQLQLLQWRCPGTHWALKSPAHLFHINTLLKVIPDASLIMTHRDPQKSVASYCSLLNTMHRVYTDRVNLNQIGASQLSQWSVAVVRAMKVRETADTNRFFDLHYEDLVEDPIGCVRKIYEFFGYDLIIIPK